MSVQFLLVSFSTLWLNRRRCVWQNRQTYLGKISEYSYLCPLSLQFFSEATVSDDIPQINSVEYVIRVSNLLEDFDEDWAEVYSYEGFYLQIGSDNSVWIASIGKLLDFNEKEYLDSTNGLLSYNTLDGKTINSAIRYNIEEGHYSVTIKGYRSKVHQKRGFLFTFDKVLSPLDYKDPRCDELYHFNLINQQ